MLYLGVFSFIHRNVGTDSCAGFFVDFFIENSLEKAKHLQYITSLKCDVSSGPPMPDFICQIWVL